eukprot:Nk52_evm2s405 gene=Nk52_evmTU2s405
MSSFFEAVVSGIANGATDPYIANKLSYTPGAQKTTSHKNVSDAYPVSEILNGILTALNRCTIVDPSIAPSFRPAFEALNNCYGVVVLKSLSRNDNDEEDAYGVILKRKPPSGTNVDNMWSWPVFVRVQKGVLSGSGRPHCQNMREVVIVLNTKDSLNKCIGNTVKLGHDVVVTPGPVKNGRVSCHYHQQTSAYGYTQSKGTIIPVSVDQLVLKRDGALNGECYGKGMSYDKILNSYHHPQERFHQLNGKLNSMWNGDPRAELYSLHTIKKRASSDKISSSPPPPPPPPAPAIHPSKIHHKLERAQEIPARPPPPTQYPEPSIDSGKGHVRRNSYGQVAPPRPAFPPQTTSTEPLPNAHNGGKRDNVDTELPPAYDELNESKIHGAYPIHLHNVIDNGEGQGNNPSVQSGSENKIKPVPKPRPRSLSVTARTELEIDRSSRLVNCVEYENRKTILDKPVPSIVNHSTERNRSVAPKPMQRRASHEAVYAFTARTEDELTLVEGEKVLVTCQDESGWWFGRRMSDGAEGVFPGNHTQSIL